MKKLIIFAAFLILSSFSVNAQSKTDSLVGNWKFKDVYQAEQQKAELVSMLREMFVDMKLELKTDKKYKFVLLGETEEGSWSYDPASKNVLIKSSKGEENKLEVISVTGNQLAISIGKGKSFILERTVTKK